MLTININNRSRITLQNIVTYIESQYNYFYKTFECSYFKFESKFYIVEKVLSGLFSSLAQSFKKINDQIAVDVIKTFG